MIDREIKALKRWRFISFFVFVGILVLFVINMTANIFYTPKKDIVLLEKDKRLYQVGDLTSNSISGGEVRQLVFDVLNKKLEFDYVSYATEDDYKNRFTGRVKKAIPDMRDGLRVWFTPRGFAEAMSELKGLPFMRNFHDSGKWVQTTVATPPKTTNGVNSQEELVGKVNGAVNRLEYIFTGRLYFEVNARKGRDERYLVTYTVKIVRDDSQISASSQNHFFTPMIEKNHSGMKIDSINFEIGE